MDEAQRAKIETGVLNCLDASRNSDEPYRRVSAFVAGLKANPAWTADEIIELQTQVIRTLLFNRGLRDNLAAANPSSAPPARQGWLGLSVFALLLMLLIVVVGVATFVGGGLVLRTQFRGLREQREEAIKALRQPPRIIPYDVEPLPSEPAPSSAP